VPRSNEDEAWRAIVENYGDRVELDPDEPATPEPVAEPEPVVVPAELASPHAEERFVPPPPPPLPHVPRDRMLAWAGLFGSPTVLLTTLVLGIGLPSLVGYLLVAAFVGGFAYLVVQMPRGPHDPWDDGARL
jgi:hypothetical protein